MNTTAAIFFLFLGQADGFASASAQAGSNLAVVPAPYTSYAACHEAGESARANNQGLSFLSFTCVPGEVSPKLVAGAGRVDYAKLPAGTVVGKPKCDEVCELIEARP